jgi:hypothetical protein
MGIFNRPVLRDPIGDGEPRVQPIREVMDSERSIVTGFDFILQEDGFFLLQEDGVSRIAQG